MSDRARVKLIEKSRRIGISWADAADAALLAASQNGSDTWYIGYNRDMAEQYIADCGAWAKHYELAASTTEEFLFEDSADRSILAFRVRFASGHRITALSSRPANLRAKKGRIVIDEAAFHDDLPGLLKAALAILMWGGSVAIISTHNGVENHFNELIEEIKRGDRDYSHHKVTLKDALKDGLYERICLVTGQPYSLEAEFAWTAELYKDYGIDAAEELDCEPFQAGAGKVFNQDWFGFITDAELPDLRRAIACRFWDFAATEKDIKSKDPCFTASVKMFRLGNLYIVADMSADQIGPAETDDKVLSLAQEDGRQCMVRWELEGGSAGPRDEYHLTTKLMGFDAEAVKPQGDKVKRAKPFASQCKAGNVMLLKRPWNKDFLRWYHAFPDGKVKDPIDAGSGCFAVLAEGGSLEIHSTGRSRSSTRLQGF